MCVYMHILPSFEVMMFPTGSAAMSVLPVAGTTCSTADPAQSTAGPHRMPCRQTTDTPRLPTTCSSQAEFSHETVGRQQCLCNLGVHTRQCRTEAEYRSEVHQTCMQRQAQSCGAGTLVYHHCAKWTAVPPSAWGRCNVERLTMASGLDASMRMQADGSHGFCTRGSLKTRTCLHSEPEPSPQD
jgi:hypothetical protein